MADSETKNKALSFMADMLVEDTEKIFEANKKDIREIKDAFEIKNKLVIK